MSAGTTPASNRTYWERKFKANVRHERKQRAALLDAGWRAGVVWECALQQKGASEGTAAKVEDWLQGRNAEFLASRLRFPFPGFGLAPLCRHVWAPRLAPCSVGAPMPALQPLN